MIFAGLFVAALFAGVWLFKNQQRLFGPNPDLPNESPSSRAYSKVQAFAIWAHVTVLTGAFALFLH